MRMMPPASAMVNLTQTALVAYPVMGAKWGFKKASAALLTASGEAARGTNDITGSLSAEEKAAFDEAVRSGVIDVTMAHDLAGIAQACARHGKGLIVDAMSSFGALPIDAREIPFDALVAASGKCLEGVPGMGFVLARKAVLEACAGNSHSLAMDLHDQYAYLQRTTQWRFTPPTHVVAALRAAVDQFLEEGGQPARGARYAANCATLIAGMRSIGLQPVLHAEVQAPIIVTFHAPASPAYNFKTFYAKVRERGYIHYPGKLTQVETFRVGCIGAIDSNEMRNVVAAVALTLDEMGIAHPAAPPQAVRT